MARLNFILLLVAVCCALSAVNATHRSRKLITQLEAEQKRMRALDVEWGQLQLELSTWAAHARIEKIARDKLAMKLPAANQIIAINPSSAR
jgi:cell division protein FtsL